MLIKLLKDIKKYKLDLVGENLIQFHVDFPKKDGYKDAYAIESLFLGKKPYIDILEYVNDKGRKNSRPACNNERFPHIMS